MVSGYDKSPTRSAPCGTPAPDIRAAFVAGAAVAAAVVLLLATLAGAWAQPCHRSYDPCLPIVSDVDCAGGGPVYVTGPIRVIGPDT